MKNPLVERFKKARAEIRNLKTAHYRGLGLVEIHEYEYTFDPGHSGLTDGNITFTIDSNFTGYPFLQVLGFSANAGGLGVVQSITPQSMDFSNNGYTVIVNVLAYYGSGVPNKYKVKSSSPITSVSYNWN